MPDEYPDPMEVRLLTDAAVLGGGMTAGSGETGLTVPVLVLKINCCAPGRIPDEEASTRRTRPTSSCWHPRPPCCSSTSSRPD